MADNYAKAKEIAAWKENVASKWDNINVVDMKLSEALTTSPVNGSAYEATIKLDTAGLGQSLGVELVVYKNEDGQVKFDRTVPFNVVDVDGDVLTYQLNEVMKDAGMFKYAFSNNVNMRCFNMCIRFAIYHKSVYNNYIYKYKHYTHIKPIHISFTNAFTNPHAMMIKIIYAFITHITMIRRFTAFDFAYWATLIEINLFKFIK